MNKTTAAFLAVLLAATTAAAVPVLRAVVDVLAPRIVEMGIWNFSTLMSCAAAPVFYLILRRMK